MKPGAHSRKRLAAACGILALSSSTTILTGTILTGTLTPAHAGEVPGRSILQTIAVTPVAGGPRPAIGIGPARVEASGVHVVAVVAPQRTRPFSLLGAVWTDPDTRPAATIEVRTRHTSDGRWTAWRHLDADEPDAADAASETAGARGSSDPLWVDDSDGVEARVVAGTRPGRAGPVLPAGLRLDLIDPDTASDPINEKAPATESRPATGSGPTTESGPVPEIGRVPVPERPVPPVVSRRAWGANDAIVERSTEYTSDVQALFVHHTATGNGYPCSQSARIIRGIQAYHVRSKGWNDIGYNFLVDRCGVLFEGRAGGITRPVLGAHTKGFNAHSTGIAVIGDYDAQGASARVRQAIARVAAYKVGMYGRDPAGRVTLTSAGSNKYGRGTRVRLNRVSAHRDVVRTDCPGNALYAQLTTIRRVAGGSVVGLTVDRLAGSIRLGSTFYTRGLVTAGWATRTSSAFIDRFDVLVDGRPTASVPGGHRAVRLRLLPGRHTLRLRAVHLSGRVAVSRVYSLFADRTAPRFTSEPVVSLGRGSLQGTVPVGLSWQATDPGGMRTVVLTRPVTTSLGAATTRWATGAAPGTATTWGFRATDRSGNTADAAVTATPLLMSESTATRSGIWATDSNPAHLDGTALRSTTAGSALTWNFTGRSASLVFSASARSGRVVISVDGRAGTVIDLRTASPGHRRVVWARNWLSHGTHTVTAAVEGTSGRPEVVSDGLAYLQ